MRLAWERHDVVRITARTSEIAALVAAARLAHAALATEPGEQAAHLGLVLADFDRAAKALQRQPQPTPDAPAPVPMELR